VCVFGVVQSLWKRVLLSGLLRDRKDGVMCKVGAF
jgi:hypothetical protein